MTRTLETLIEQYNRATELDRTSRIATGETFWAEVDGVRTRMVEAWVKELSPEENLIFETYITGVMDGVAQSLGYENSTAYFSDIPDKMFRGMAMGIATGAAVKNRS